jgi:TetR/AcrR family transcriptional regulator, transcriptional repressor for nem operon
MIVIPLRYLDHLFQERSEMRYPADHKDLSRQRILLSASRLIRARGIDGVSVAAAMKDAGLTHGSFYAHFASKDALVAQSIRYAMNEVIGRLRDLARESPDRPPLEVVVEAYLSDAHLAQPWSGCAVASLCQEVDRASPAIRRAMEERVNDMLDFLAGYVPLNDSSERADVARALYAVMLGGLDLAKAVQDRKARQAILAAARRVALELLARPRE